MLVRSGVKESIVNVSDIEWIEAADYYSCLHIGTKGLMLRKTIKHLAETLDPENFVRIHRSTIVQVERIARVDPSSNRDAVLTLRDGKTLRVSRTYRLRLDELLHSP